MAEKKIMDIEEELKIVGANMQTLEMSEEKMEYHEEYAKEYANEQRCGSYKREVEEWLSGGGEGE